MLRFALHRHWRKGAAVAAIAGMGASIAACSPQTTASAAAQPLSVACEANQRAVVRQIVLNGAAQSQVTCEPLGTAVGTSGTIGADAPAGYAAAPVAYSPAPRYRYAEAPNDRYAQTPRYGYTQAPIDDTRYVRTVHEPAEVSGVPEHVVYQRVPERRVVYRPKRSVRTSALIIGSSAAGGAGLGALIGGKKGAGIGAIAGGGAAALWDQITRRRQ